jgi:hypothetical protein
VPYLYEIEILDDQVLIRSEFYGSERTVFMDGRSHPENAERTLQGHSLGWWEGEVLVVDTVQFSDLRNGNMFGIPSGAQKHVVERYELSEDGTRLLINFVLEDPEYLVEPFEGNTYWDFSPGTEMLPFTCDLENARRYILE